MKAMTSLHPLVIDSLAGSRKQHLRPSYIGTGVMYYYIIISLISSTCRDIPYLGAKALLVELLSAYDLS